MLTNWITRLLARMLLLPWVILLYPSFFFGGTVPTSRQPTVPGYKNMIFDSSILILCSTNIIYDYTFFIFIGSLFFFFFAIFDGSIITLNSTNIRFDHSFVAFDDTLIFFSHIWYFIVILAILTLHVIEHYKTWGVQAAFFWAAF